VVHLLSITCVTSSRIHHDLVRLQFWTRQPNASEFAERLLSCQLRYACRACRLRAVADDHHLCFYIAWLFAAPPRRLVSCAETSLVATSRRVSNAHAAAAPVPALRSTLTTPLYCCPTGGVHSQLRSCTHRITRFGLFKVPLPGRHLLILSSSCRCNTTPSCRGAAAVSPPRTFSLLTLRCMP